QHGLRRRSRRGHAGGGGRLQLVHRPLGRRVPVPRGPLADGTLAGEEVIKMHRAGRLRPHGNSPHDNSTDFHVMKGETMMNGWRRPCGWVVFLLAMALSPAGAAGEAIELTTGEQALAFGD